MTADLPPSLPTSNATSIERGSGPRKVLLAQDALFLSHVSPPGHPERPERLLAVQAGLERAATRLHATYTALPACDATDDELARVHEAQYIESLGHLAGQSGYLDSDTFISAGSVPAARRAAGSALALTRALDAGQARVGFALPRPPGHHALADRAMGFCLLNNIAIAAAEARRLGRKRVLVLDWDVHHGNGTEAIFYDDPSVLFVSLHQYPNYPGTGAAADTGRGEGRGRTVNLPLPPGGTDALYRAAFERIVLPIVEQFSPDFALVSCGFDAHARDPLAQMQLSAAAYGDMTASLLEHLDDCPLGIVLEGGYDLEALTDSAEAVASELFGASPTPAVAPADDGLFAEEAETLAQIGRTQAEFWRL
jgi:acetoin utilization deacetylase AcuC-like enzyme